MTDVLGLRKGGRGRGSKPQSVFDRGSGQGRGAPPGPAFNQFAGFRRDRKDAIPARETVTGQLLGDPPPGKFNHVPLWDPETGTIRGRHDFVDPYHSAGGPK